MPVSTIPQPLQSQIAAGQAQATEMLRQLLAGESILPAGYTPTVDTLRDLYNIVTQYVAAKGGGAEPLDLTKFYQAYVFPYLTAPGQKVRTAAWDFLSRMATMRPEDRTAASALLSALGTVAPTGAIPTMREAAQVLQELGPVHAGLPTYQEVLRQVVSGLGGNLATMTPALWDIATNVWYLASQYAPDLAARIQLQLPQTLTPYTAAQRMALQEIAQLMAGTKGLWIGPRGLEPTAAQRTAETLQGLREIIEGAGAPEITPATGPTLPLPTVGPTSGGIGLRGAEPVVALDKALSEVKLENKATGAGKAGQTVTGGQIARVRTRTGWKLLNVDRVAQDIKQLAGLFPNAAEFEKWLIQHGSELAQVLGTARLAQLRAWARNLRQWPSPPKDQERWGGVGRDPIEIYLSKL